MAQAVAIGVLGCWFVRTRFFRSAQPVRGRLHRQTFDFGASNFFVLAVAAVIVLFGLRSGEPVMPAQNRSSETPNA